ncbi:MAG: DUF308 domain-containing protein [Rikenellaceae bacterium]
MNKKLPSSLSRARWLVLLTGILFTLFGIISLISTGVAIEVASIYIGIVSILAGLTSISYAITNYTFVGWAWAMIEGVVDLIFGILVIKFPMATVAILPLLIGIWVLFRGLIFIVDAFGSNKRYPTRSALSRFSIGLILMVLGFALIIDWDLKKMVISVIVSVSFVFIGLWNLVAGLDLYAKPQRFP